MLTSRFSKSALTASLLTFPVAARAECLSDGCYDGLLWVFGGMIAAIFVVIILAIWVARRWGKRYVFWGLLAAVAAYAVMSAVWFSGGF